MVEQQLSRSVRHFSYPYDEAVRWGRRLPPAQAEWVREAGFATGVTVVEGTVDRSTDPLAIPRLAVGDWPVEEFVQALLPHLHSNCPSEAARTAWNTDQELPADLGIT